MSIDAKADIIEPFTTSNISPFVQIHGIPVVRSAQLVPYKKLSWQIQTDIANNYTTDEKTNESIKIDGETYRLNLSLRYGLTDKLEVGMDIPYLRHSSGHLDGAIEAWHDLFGLPNGDREDDPRNQLDYSYLSNPTSVALRSSVRGLGDIRLNLGYQFLEREDQVWSIRTGIKLPTGDADKMTGSEGTDISLGVHLAQINFLGKESLYFHGSLGVLSLGDGEVIEERVEDWATYASSTLAWQYSEKLSLKAQFDLHTALYDSDLDELGDVAGQLTFGGSVNLGSNTQLDLSISEDIIVDTAPDVVFSISLRSRF